MFNVVKELKEGHILYTLSIVLLLVVLIIDNLNLIGVTLSNKASYLMLTLLLVAMLLFSVKVTSAGNPFIVGFVSDLFTVILLTILLTSPIASEKELLLIFYTGKGFSVFSGIFIFFEVATMDFLADLKSTSVHMEKMARTAELIKETEEKLRVLNEEIKAREESMRDE